MPGSSMTHNISIAFKIAERNKIKFNLVDFPVSRFRWAHAFSQSNCSQISLSHVVGATSPSHGTTVIALQRLNGDRRMILLA